MKLLSRVVWSEGMYLGPHHFQAQGRYFEDSIQFATSNVWFRPYGLVGCEFNAEALSNGTLSVVHARGVFPDGLTFHMPEADSLPSARNITDLFPPTHDTLTYSSPSRRVARGRQLRLLRTRGRRGPLPGRAARAARRKHRRR